MLKRHNNMRQHIIELQQYWDCHGMTCLYNVLFNQIAHKYNCSDTTLQLTWSKLSIHNYYNMFLSCRFLGNNIAIIMTFNIHRTCCLTEIYLKISKHNTIFIVSQCNTHPAMLFWQRGISYEKSSEVIPSQCEHVSSDEDCSSRITNCR